MKNKRVFVSGGSGVIGLEIVPKLLARGAKVIVGDLKSRPSSFEKSVIYRQGDLNTLTEEEFKAFRPDIFIHLAATFERSVESYEFWEENFLHNVQLSHHLMTLAKNTKSLQKVVFASSYLIYDQTLYQFNTRATKAIPLNETDSVLPRNLTGAAKLSHEIELRFLDKFKSEQFTIACARIFRGYGRNSRDVISRWVRDLLVGNPITVYREEGLFDYIYAVDSAEGLIRLAESKKASGIFNLGSGRARRVSEVVDTLCRYFPGAEVKRCEANIAFEASEADMTKYDSIIGWRPEYSIETAIPEIIEFERQKLASLNQPIRRLPSILITSSSRKAPLIKAVQNAIKKIDSRGVVWAGDLSRSVITAHVADNFWEMPPASDEFLENIIEGCKDREITLILPTRDGELMFWSKNSPLFENAGIKVILSKSDSIMRCIDKLAFAKFGQEMGFPFIETSKDINDLDCYRYVVKERFGAGARAIGVDLEKDKAMLHAKNLMDPIFQPYIKGDEISIDAWLSDEYCVKGLVMRRRELLLNGESQVTTTFRNNNFEKLITKILGSLKLVGPVVMQAFITDSNKLQVIECNARFGGASTASIAAGLDSIYWSILQSQGENLDDYLFCRSTNEIRQIRVPSDIHITI
jgi:carbamoyl-phosphate synthase large subunit